MRPRCLLPAILLTLTACSADPPPPHGSAALSPPMASTTTLAAWVGERTGACRDVTTPSREDFARFIGPQWTTLYQPFVAEWATCSVPPNFPKVGLLVFRDGRFPEFQAHWREAMASGRVNDGPAFGFGNGFAVTQGFLATSRLGLYYLRCHYDDPQVHRIPADVEGCVFANPEHHH
ncbi:hypothetical protein [Amycolatopsis sp. NPDC059657]|uniref:hypothetical protein n=1 Tax=Amycolatopsis sp. NPDC059657 TaxID=3346899 RepID=UPI00366EC526